MTDQALEIRRGDEVTFDVTVVPASSLVGATLQFMVKRTESETDAAAVVNINSVSHPSQFTINTGTGACTVKLLSSNTSGLPGRRTVLRWWLKISTAPIVTLAKGTLTVEAA